MRGELAVFAALAIVGGFIVYTTSGVLEVLGALAVIVGLVGLLVQAVG